MSPQDRLEFEQMKLTVRQLREVLDVPFIENIKRRAVTPLIESGFVTFQSDSTTTGVLRSVNEGGAGTYNVADAYDDAVITKINGIDYKIGVYTP